ncbi:hypothetical protein [Shewanella sp. 10N.286.52.B9]|uniref:hypothetical protein n=1 Tax=Shewanella sp. 10N.286.52.B9 TaxID=1880837 RepID=UPI000C84F4FB|nr:hypothetical protein [Shewanella sp. 10N.286.52.B9]PMG51083.1 hypothetical protein BCU91_16950 [Shewanella sp. 10N.286.52.B9]
MSDLFNSFISTDDFVFLLSSTPLPLQPYLLAINELSELPIQQEYYGSIDGEIQLNDLHLPFSQGLPSLIDVTHKKDPIKELAKIEGIEQTLESEQQSATSALASLFTPLRELEPLSDIKLIQKFANASSLATAFCSSARDDINLLPSFCKGSEPLLHAALANQMAGLIQQAHLLYQLFIDKQLIDSNEQFQRLLSEIGKHKAIAKKASSNAKKGHSKRHSLNRQRQEFALSLLRKKKYPSARHAAKCLYPEINEFGEQIGVKFTDEFQGRETIERWFRPEMKKT